MAAVLSLWVSDGPLVVTWRKGPGDEVMMLSLPLSWLSADRELLVLKNHPRK